MNNEPVEFYGRHVDNITVEGQSKTYVHHDYLYASSKLTLQCNHKNKEIYKGMIFTTDPPSYKWRCKHCDEIGFTLLPELN